MTKNELINLINWNDIGIGNCMIYTNLFGKKIMFSFFASDTKHPTISEKMLQTLNDVLSIEEDSVNLIKNLLWEECTFAFQVADYGCLKNKGETHLQAHLREFGLASKEDAYQKSELEGIRISCDNDILGARYAEIEFDSASSNLISIIVKNGVIIDFDDNGTWLGQFENELTYAEIKRKKVLSRL